MKSSFKQNLSFSNKISEENMNSLWFILNEALYNSIQSATMTEYIKKKRSINLFNYFNNAISVQTYFKHFHL